MSKKFAEPKKLITFATLLDYIDSRKKTERPKLTRGVGLFSFASACVLSLPTFETPHGKG